MDSFNHYSVMLGECIDGLAIKPDGNYADLTAGGGGHSFEIAKRLGAGGHLYSFDTDERAIDACRERLASYSDRVSLIHANFERIAEFLSGVPLDGVMCDLGVSSYQLDTPERGFSYMHDAPLDMRMDTDADFSAYDVVNGYDERRLAKVLTDWGEERFAGRIAYNICGQRGVKPIETTFELNDIIRRSIPRRNQDGGHPSKRTFQAIRIEVNRELDVIEPTVRSAVSLLAPGGRMCVLTFHSLEDRIVKQTFNSMINGCTCPHDFPVCVCGFRPTIKLITRKPVTACESELAENSRSHSAKLRIIEKL